MSAKEKEQFILKDILSIAYVFDLVWMIALAVKAPSRNSQLILSCCPSRMCSSCNLWLSSDRWLKEPDSRVWGHLVLMSCSVSARRLKYWCVFCTLWTSAICFGLLSSEHESIIFNSLELLIMPHLKTHLNINVLKLLKLIYRH